MRKMASVLVCIVIMLQLTGCWSRREPTNLAISDSAIYSMQEDNSYYVLLDIVNPGTTSKGKASTDGAGGKSVQIEGKGVSIPEAIRDVSSNMDRRVYVAHNKARFFTEKFARNGMTDVLDYIFRDNEYRQSSYMIVLKTDKPELIYKASTGLAGSIGSYIEGIASSQMATKSDAVFVTSLEFGRDYYLDGKEPVATVLEVVEDKENSGGSEKGEQKSSEKKAESDATSKYKLKTDGLAAFKDDKLVGYMTDTEARAYNFITDKFKGAFISSINTEDKGSPNNNIVFEVKPPKTQIKTSMQDGKVNIEVKLKMKLFITQYGEKENTTDSEVIKKATKQFDEKIKNEIMSSIKKAQSKFRSDIFGFGLYFHIDNPKQWKDIKTKWDDYFADANVNVEVKSSVYVPGEMKQPFILEED